MQRRTLSIYPWILPLGLRSRNEIPSTRNRNDIYTVSELRGICQIPTRTILRVSYSSLLRKRTYTAAFSCVRRPPRSLSGSSSTGNTDPQTQLHSNPTAEITGADDGGIELWILAPNRCGTGFQFYHTEATLSRKDGYTKGETESDGSY